MSNNGDNATQPPLARIVIAYAVYMPLWLLYSYSTYLGISYVLEYGSPTTIFTVGVAAFTLINLCVIGYTSISTVWAARRQTVSRTFLILVLVNFGLLLILTFCAAGWYSLPTTQW